MSLREKLDQLASEDNGTAKLTGVEFLELAKWSQDDVSTMTQKLGKDFTRVVIHAEYAAMNPELWREMKIYLRRNQETLIMSAMLD